MFLNFQAIENKLLAASESTMVFWPNFKPGSQINHKQYATFLIVWISSFEQSTLCMCVYYMFQPYIASVGTSKFKQSKLSIATRSYLRL